MDGSATRNARTAGSSSARKRSYTWASTRIRERAQQSWPALSKTPAGAAAAAAARSASANTMLALLPPSSSVTRFTCSAQPAMICLPTSVEPVKHTLRTAGWVTNRCPTTDPRPGTTVNTPSGSPASRPSSARRSAVSGVTLAGLSTTVLPAARAGAKPHAAIGIGKFHGTITPTTPSGSWKVTSTPPGTGICRPVNRAGVVVQDVADVASLPPGVADGVSRVAHLQPGQLLDVTVHDGREAAQQPGPVARRDGPPGRERGHRLLDGAIHLRRGRRRHVREDLLGRRVDHVHGSEPLE